MQFTPCGQRAITGNSLQVPSGDFCTHGRVLDVSHILAPAGAGSGVATTGGADELVGLTAWGGSGTGDAWGADATGSARGGTGPDGEAAADVVGAVGAVATGSGPGSGGLR